MRQKTASSSSSSGPRPLLVIAAGGTGGHMFPAQALAETIMARGWRVKLATDGRGAHYAKGFPVDVTRQIMPSATFARGSLAARLAVPATIAAGIFKAINTMRRERPAAVIGFGGYPSIPAMAAATLMGIPRMVHEQNGTLGKVNRMFARRVDLVACGIWPTAVPKGARTVHTGNPVRARIRARGGAAYAAPARQGAARLLVFGGSQGARILGEVVPAAVCALPGGLRDRVEVIQQARSEQVEQVRAAYGSAGITARVEPFIADIDTHLAQAHLVIARAGCCHQKLVA